MDTKIQLTKYSQKSIEDMANLCPPEQATIFCAANGLDQGAVVECLRDRGFCIIRGLFSETLLDQVIVRANFYLSRPAIAGAPGYWKKDYQKKLVNPFTLGGPTLDVLLDERVIDIIEHVLGSECILAETMLKFDIATPYVYFPMHSDFAIGWAKSTKIKRVLNADDLQEAVGIGGALYLDDTDEGAFAYCDGTHFLMSPKGQKLTSYSKAEQSIIQSRKVCCTGNRGDLVLFDDRGFHGPDQPSKKDRTVILLDYFSVDKIGRLQVSPMPIWSNDIANMSPKQSRVAGVGAQYMVDPTEYTHTNFRKTFYYRLMSYFLSIAYFSQHLKMKLKNWIN